MSTQKESTPSGTLEERLSFYSSEALPNSIKNIADNSKNLTPVIEYLEQAYLTAPDQHTQAEVETQAKSYLVDALTTVVGDINTIAQNLEQFVGLQAEAVGGLGTQMDMLRTKMTLYKEQHGTQKCSAFKDEVVTTSGTYSRKADHGEGSSARLLSVLLPAAALSDGLKEGEREAGHEEHKEQTRRVPLHDRLARLDGVGVCLDKEEGRQNAKAAVMASSSVLRRASHTRAHQRRASAPAPPEDDASVVSGAGDDDDVSVMSTSSQGSSLVPPPRLSTLHH